MKRLFLLTSLLLSTNTWAEDEFPIKLTCELGDAILFIHLNENKEKSWYMPHEEAPTRDIKTLNKDAGQKNPFLNYEVEDSYIHLVMGSSSFRSVTFIINRFSLGLTGYVGYEASISKGQCYKGFKEYEKQI